MQKVSISPIYTLKNCLKSQMHKKNSNFCIIKTTEALPAKFFTVMKTTEYSFGCPKICLTNPKWRTAAILKKA